jgi:hypothetical protein
MMQYFFIIHMHLLVLIFICFFLIKGNIRRLLNETYHLRNTPFRVQIKINTWLSLTRFFIGYWILKRGWIFILALFLLLSYSISGG